MKKIISGVALIASILFVACRQNPIVPHAPTIDKPYYDEAYGLYDSNRIKTDLLANHWQSNYTIKANGTAINMPNIKSLFAFTISYNAGILSGEGRPVNVACKNELSATAYNNLPVSIHHIVYDDQGNSLWLRIDNISMSLFNPLIPVFNGESTVMGGTGKFANSTGIVYFSGQLDIMNPTHSMIRNEGTVKYY